MPDVNQSFTDFTKQAETSRAEGLLYTCILWGLHETSGAARVM